MENEMTNLKQLLKGLYYGVIVWTLFGILLTLA